ncbi:Uncharacterized protein ZK688.7 [Eumeta japonica]|uniref:Uncharacterized protein ZK688.7 n=1 Tax=Eumeta variegata TaxID=151549 RepID=A0A4C1ZT45_EUMVA|nr:Uncharacterized protein ZK688.7 [Eumeta japonica]
MNNGPPPYDRAEAATSRIHSTKAWYLVSQTDPFPRCSQVGHGTALEVSMNSAVIFLHCVVDLFKAVCQLTPWVVYEGDSLFWAIREDHLRGTTRNTTEALIGLVHAIGNGLLLCPGIGTLIGGLMGSLFLLVAGDYVCRQIASSVLDSRGYNIGLYRCQKCNRRYLCRDYTGQSRVYCPNCSDDDGWQIRRF